MATLTILPVTICDTQSVQVEDDAWRVVISSTDVLTPRCRCSRKVSWLGWLRKLGRTEKLVVNNLSMCICSATPDNGQ